MYAEDTRKRALTKTISWRVIATLLTFVVVYLYTGEPVTSIATTLTVAVINTTAYYVHERAWTHMKWGKKLVRQKTKRTPQRA